ncbi:DUF1783-domain-containing protein [Exidia glandulosa HHB12029]|uniref:DUF1783-domain-containing protein n=1 Tax=Exidia glandulosa HHB12029 TaxID=1314781 RepID=A0A165DQD1_EXIGL|nr:DUF1783-domain-containing protein [Exidia glandulosa HHB12029]
MPPPPPPPRTFSRPVRELPELEGRSPMLWMSIGLGVLGWVAFVMRATNSERATSSVMRQIIYELKRSDEVEAALGANVKPEPGWFVYGGHPHVQGSMSVLQGKVDISFRISGKKGAGTVYFTSIRKNKGQKFLILRFRIVCDDGTIVSLREKYEEGLLFEQPPTS